MITTQSVLYQYVARSRTTYDLGEVDVGRRALFS
jgi:hypothetical protein